jgi:ribosome-binding ATPase
VVGAFSPDANPERDIRTVLDEMILLDQAMLESTIDKKTRKTRLTGDKSEEREMELFKRCLSFLESERPLLEMDIPEDEARMIRGYQFLSQKPLLIVLNIGEDDLANAAALAEKHKGLVEAGKRELAVVCGKIEAELVSLEEAERKVFMEELGITQPAMHQVVQRSYALLGLISYLTAGEPEVRAWTIKKGTNAQHAAGVIHSDIERGFIRAEVTHYDDYVRYQTPAALKAAGKTRLEGKEYIVVDGDVVLFRFNV